MSCVLMHCAHWDWTHRKCGQLSFRAKSELHRPLYLVHPNGMLFWILTVADRFVEVVASFAFAHLLFQTASFITAQHVCGAVQV